MLLIWVRRAPVKQGCDEGGSLGLENSERTMPPLTGLWRRSMEWVGANSCPGTDALPQPHPLVSTIHVNSSMRTLLSPPPWEDRFHPVPIPSPANFYPQISPIYADGKLGKSKESVIGGLICQILPREDRNYSRPFPRRKRQRTAALQDAARSSKRGAEHQLLDCASPLALSATTSGRVRKCPRVPEVMAVGCDAGRCCS